MPPTESYRGFAPSSCLHLQLTCVRYRATIHVYHAKQVDALQIRGWQLAWTCCMLLVTWHTPRPALRLPKSMAIACSPQWCADLCLDAEPHDMHKKQLAYQQYQDLTSAEPRNDQEAHCFAAEPAVTAIKTEKMPHLLKPTSSIAGGILRLSSPGSILDLPVSTSATSI